MRVSQRKFHNVQGHWAHPDLTLCPRSHIQWYRRSLPLHPGNQRPRRPRSFLTCWRISLRLCTALPNSLLVGRYETGLCRSDNRQWYRASLIQVLFPSRVYSLWLQLRSPYFTKWWHGSTDYVWRSNRIPSPSALMRIFHRKFPPGGTEIPDLYVKEEFREFLASHRSIAFPQPREQHHAFNGLRIYW